jgi:SAM-dependent methyltransferase
MGEIFLREAMAHPAPFTGERLTSAGSGQVQIEHYHRYQYARALCRDLDVLDVASGEGYGAAMLAQVARSVIGLEYDGPTVARAAAWFARPNLNFLRGDARSLPFADASVDAVVSFETIEHFDQQDLFVREVRRVLRPDGWFLVSSPDRDVYSPLGSQPNPHHVQELTKDEFVALLGGSFRHISILRQRPMIGSALLADTGTALSPLVFDQRGDRHFEACTGLPRAPYLVAVASEGEIPPLPPSLFINRSDLDTDKAVLLDQYAKYTKSTALLEQCTVKLEQLQGELAACRITCTEAIERNTTLEQEFDLMQGSFRRFLRGYLPRLQRHLRGGHRRMPSTRL